MKNRTNGIERKGFEFAFKIVHCYNYLADAKKENYFSSRLLKSGNAILNSIEDAQAANSKPEYYTNLSASRNEAQKTRTYLNLLKAAHILETEAADELLKETDEYCRILTALLFSSGIRKSSHNTNIQ
ncbi:MAG: four helix bundle protein [Bacteroidales bacterium]|nr:four helix bundle protein [Bacteroidales bacterium]